MSLESDLAFQNYESVFADFSPHELLSDVAVLGVCHRGDIMLVRQPEHALQRVRPVPCRLDVFHIFEARRHPPGGDRYSFQRLAARVAYGALQVAVIERSHVDVEERSFSFLHVHSEAF